MSSKWGALMAIPAHDAESGSSIPNSKTEPNTPRKPEKSSHLWRSRYAKIMSSQWFAGIVSGLITGALVTFSITATGHSTDVRMFADDPPDRVAKL
jgi:hypothetical protein